MTIRRVEQSEKNLINEVVEIHLKTFPGFFLTFMGKGFLRELYMSYCKHELSGLLVALGEEGHPIGFLAYSENVSALYKFNWLCLLGTASGHLFGSLKYSCV